MALEMPAGEGAIDRIIADEPDIEEAFRSITVQFGPDTMLASKIRLRKGISIETAVAVINRLERRLKDEIPGLAWSFVEPDLED